MFELTKYSDHLVSDNIEAIVAVLVLTLIFYFSMFWFTFYAVDSLAHARVGQNAESTWKHYVALSTEKRYKYSSYILSMINAVFTSGMAIPVSMKCDPPAGHRNDEVFLGNTYFRNSWCVDNPHIYEALFVRVFTGYLITDFYVQIVLLKDWKSSGGQQNIFHHFVSISMATGSLFLSGYFLPTGTVSLLTELSTPFVNMRWFLYTHKNY